MVNFPKNNYVLKIPLVKLPSKSLTIGFESYTTAEIPAGVSQVLFIRGPRQNLSGNLIHGESAVVPSLCGTPISLPKVLENDLLVTSLYYMLHTYNFA